jgi:hypothetical protein
MKWVQTELGRIIRSHLIAHYWIVICIHNRHSTVGNNEEECGRSHAVFLLESFDSSFLTESGNILPCNITPVKPLVPLRGAVICTDMITPLSK